MLHLIPNLTRSVLDTGVVISLLSKIADAANGPCGTALSHHEFDIETKGTFPLAPMGESDFRTPMGPSDPSNRGGGTARRGVGGLYQDAYIVSKPQKQVKTQNAKGKSMNEDLWHCLTRPQSF